jgi:hypothetical protein
MRNDWQFEFFLSQEKDGFQKFNDLQPVSGRPRPHQVSGIQKFKQMDHLQRCGLGRFQAIQARSAGSLELHSYAC